MVLVFDQPMKV